MIWRPQAKRAKEQKNLLSSLQKGDEVVTTGGIAGKITKVADDFVVLEVSDTVEMTFQKGAIAATLTKRSEERRDGRECVSKCSTGWSPVHAKKTKQPDKH